MALRVVGRSFAYCPFSCLVGRSSVPPGRVGVPLAHHPPLASAVMRALTPPLRCVTPRALCRAVPIRRVLCSAPRLAHPRTSLRCCATQLGAPASSGEGGGASAKSLSSLERRSWGVAW